MVLKFIEYGVRHLPFKISDVLQFNRAGTILSSHSTPPLEPVWSSQYDVNRLGLSIFVPKSSWTMCSSLITALHFFFIQLHIRWIYFIYIPTSPWTENERNFFLHFSRFTTLAGREPTILKLNCMVEQEHVNRVIHEDVLNI